MEILQKAQKQVLTDGKCLSWQAFTAGAGRPSWVMQKMEEQRELDSWRGKEHSWWTKKPRRAHGVEDREKTRESEGKEGETETELDSPPTS